MSKVYEVYVTKSAVYCIEAESEEEALNIADEWLNDREFDRCVIREIDAEDEE